MAAPSDGRAAANRPVQSRQRACTPCPCPSLTSHTATLAHTQRARAIRLSTAATMRTVDMAALLWAVLAWVAIGERGGRATAHFFFFDLDPPACTPPSFLLAPLPTLSRFSSSLAPHPSPPPPPKHARPRPTPSPPLTTTTTPPFLRSHPPRVRLPVPRARALPALVGRHRLVHAPQVPAPLWAAAAVLWAARAAGAVLRAQAAGQLGARAGGVGWWHRERERER